MFIVLFHVLYLFGKLIYTRYNCGKQTENPETVESECGCGDTRFSLGDQKFGVKKLAQPPGDNSDDEEKMPRGIKFFPPAYIQRYVAVQAVLADTRYKGKIRKVVDFGCSELGFLVYLKNTPGIEEILCVDIDKDLLESCQQKAQPLHMDYLHTRDTPLSIHIIEGSVTQNDKLLEKTDAVICIELIEHLYPNTLTDLPYNIFGYIKPKVVIITTPNFEFNVLFGNPGFRHYDHKFEWTRKQFQDWADNIVSRFPEYEVSITGICKGPPGSEHLGCCSQMAIFHRNMDINEYVLPGVENLFNVITTIQYPFRVDNRSDEQKILDDAVYFIRSYSMYSLEFSDEVPLKKLIEPLKKYHITVESLKELLEQNEWNIADRDDGPVVLIPEPSDSESSSERGRWNDLDLSWNDQDNPEDEWDLDPGPPSHYSGEQLTNIAISQENWGDEPSIPIESVQDEAIVEENDSSIEIVRLMTPEPIVEILDNTNRNQDVEIDNETELENTSNPSSNFVLPGNIGCSSNFMRSSSPLSFNFKEILNHTTELPSYQLPQTEFESQSPNDRSKNLPRRTYRKSQKIVQSSPKHLMDELGSLCSIYLESSRNENFKTCFEDLSNCSFESTISATSSVNDSKLDEIPSNGISTSAKKLRMNDSLSSFSSNLLNVSSQFTSSSKMPNDLKRKVEKNEQLRKQDEFLNEEDLWEGLKTPESISNENFLQSTSNFSLLSFSNDSKPSSSIEGWYPIESNSMYKSLPATLKGESDAADQPRDNIRSDSNLATSNEDTKDEDVDSLRVNNKSSLDKFKDSQESLVIPETKLVDGTFCIKEIHETNLTIDGAYSLEIKDSKSYSSQFEDFRICRNLNPSETIESLEDRESSPKSEIPIEEPENLRDDSESEKMIIKSQASFVFKDSCASKALDLSEIIEVKAISSETLDTPPNSWSPEVMDSGYPNSASAHDMTPEYDLPSIAHDRISDSESPSIEEAPRPGLLELVEVENGDLANNNRDYEGNNMIAVEDNEDDDLQPLIDVLENDMENENDIYVLQNGFPAWLLRILQRQEIEVVGHRPLFHPLDIAGRDAVNADFDEGFSSSSEEDEVEEDDESVSMVSKA